MTRNDEEGQAFVLLLGLTLVVFLVVGLAVDGTRAFLLQRTMQNVADSAAVSAASAIDKRLYHSSGGKVINLDPTLVDATTTRIFEERGLPMEINLATRNDVIEISARTSSPTTFLRLAGIHDIPVGARAAATPFSLVVPPPP